MSTRIPVQTYEPHYENIENIAIGLLKVINLLNSYTCIIMTVFTLQW